jgi:lipopolysaccharide/colanic/teichoic acid biosynthesis glycosyltransferase
VIEQVNMRAAAAKRATDMTVALVLILVTLPVMVVALVGTALSLRTWPFFSHERIGRNGTPFRMVKFRTLPASTPAYAAKYDLAEVDVPWFCRTLRRLHLDELPQLFLVLTGSMALVGPRPEMAHLCAEFDPAFAARRAQVRPGCTGLWQISDRCDRLIHEHPEFDELYLRHQSLSFDLWIIARSARNLLPGGHVVTFDEVVDHLGILDLADRPEVIDAPGEVVGARVEHSAVALEAL